MLNNKRETNTNVSAAEVTHSDDSFRWSTFENCLQRLARSRWTGYLYRIYRVCTFWQYSSIFYLFIFFISDKLTKKDPLKKIELKLFESKDDEEDKKKIWWILLKRTPYRALGIFVLEGGINRSCLDVKRPIENLDEFRISDSKLRFFQRKNNTRAM